MLNLKQKEPWWLEYRRRKYRSLPKPSMETLVRRCIRDTCREYVRNCSLAGVSHIFDPVVTWKEKILWIAFSLLMFGMTGYFLRYLWIDSLAKPLIVTMESSTYPISEIDFPAVAICNINRISKKGLGLLTEITYPNLRRNVSLEELRWFLLQLGKLIDSSYNENLRNHPLMGEIASTHFNSVDIIKAMEDITPKCEDMIMHCIWDSQIVNCSSIFSLRRTVHGHCCTFNYILNYSLANSPVKKKISEVKRQLQPGLLQGLTVVLDPMLEDYAYPLFHIRGFEILLFDPTHFADPRGGRVTQRFVEPNQAVLMELRSIKQVATREVRKYGLATRKCAFHDELSTFGNHYSYSACIVQCRIRTIQSLCKCTPYYLPTTDDVPVCTLEDLRCLNKYKEKMGYMYPHNAEDVEGLEIELEDSLFCPDCFPDCELTQHYTKSSKVPYIKGENKKDKMNTFLADANTKDKSLLCIYQNTADGTLDRLDVVSYWFELLSNVGGASGIFIGLSVISFMELVYFLFIRSVQILLMHIRKYS